MDLETAKSVLLEYGWGAGQRSHIRSVLQFVEENSECRRMAEELDVVRVTLRLDAGDEPLPTGGWDSLDHRLGCTISGTRMRLGWRPIAWAATIGLLLAAPWYWLWSSRQEENAAFGRSWAILQPTQVEVGQRLGLFRELTALYDHKAGWVVVGNGTIEVGLTDETARKSSDSSVLRLAVLRGSDVVSQVDVVTASGEIAHVCLPLDESRTLCYRLKSSETQPGRVGLHAEIQESGSQASPLAALSRELALTAGQVDGVGDLVTMSGTYSLKIAYAKGQPEA